MQSLILVLAAFLLFAALPYLITYRKVLKQTYWCFWSETVSSEQMPEHLRALFQPTIAILETCGFQVAEYHLIQHSTEDQKRWSILLQHRSHQIYAGCILGHSLNPSNPVIVTLSSFFDEGKLLATLNTELTGIYSQDPQAVTQYLGSAVSIDDQWQAHQRKLAEMSQPQVLSIAAFTKCWKTYSRSNVERLVQTQEVYWVEPGESYRMSRWTAAKAIAKVARRKQRNKAQSSTNQQTAVEPTIELELDGFYQWQHRRKQGGFSPKTKRWLMWGTLAFFIAVYALRFNPQSTILFVAALLLHEGGHVLAMKWFGYRDATMLFIPFLGALATARKDNASLTEKVWISLAGPLPGLMLGVGLAVAFNPFSVNPVGEFGWVRQASEILIILNLFNLLPIYPLDGGQVADLLLFSRHPYLGVIFKAIGVVLLSLLGLQQPLLLAFAVLIGRTIPHSFRLAKLNAALRPELQQLPAEAPDTIVRFLFTKLHNSRYRSLPFAQKYVLVLGLLDSRQEHAAKWTTRVGLSGVYLISLIAGVVGGLYSLIPNWQLLGVTLSSMWQTLKVADQRQMQQLRDRATERLKTNPQDVQAFLQRGRAKLALEDYPGTLADANQILKLDPNNAQGYQLRGDIRFQSGDKKAAAADFDQVQRLRKQKLEQQIGQLNQTLSRNPKAISAYLERADTYAALGRHAAAISDCNQVLKLDARNVQALLSRADIYMSLKDYHRAIRDADQILSLEPNSIEAYGIRGDAREQLGDQAGARADAQTAEALEHAQNQLK